MTSIRSPRGSSSNSSSNAHPSLPSPSSYIRTNSILIQTDDGRKFDSGIIKQQYHFNDSNSSSSPYAYSAISYSSPYYNYHHRKNRSFLKPILAALIVIAILVYLLISQKMHLASFSLEKASSSETGRIPKPNNIANVEIIEGSSNDTIDMMDDSIENRINSTKTISSKIEGDTDDYENIDVGDDALLRGMEDDDTMYNSTSLEVIANEDTIVGGGNYTDGNSTIDFIDDAPFDADNEATNNDINYNITSTDGSDPIS